MNAQRTPERSECPSWLDARPTTLQEHRDRALVMALINASSVWCAERLAELARRLHNPTRSRGRRRCSLDRKGRCTAILRYTVASGAL